MTSEALVKDKVLAPSLLGLPPEVRLEIYRHLLVYHAYILPIPRNWYTKSYGFWPETAILRTCRQIYLEAVSVLYGENTFSYLCCMSAFDVEYHIEVPFSDQNIHLIKHLEIKVDSRQDIDPGSVAATIQYFTSRDCEFQTFRLLLENFTIGTRDDLVYLIGICGNGQLYGALVELQISRSLSIDLAYCQYKTRVKHGHEGTVGETHFPGMIEKLASTKNFKIMQEKSFSTEFLGDMEKAEMRDFFRVVYGEFDPDSYFTKYHFSWCLRPQHSEVQTDTAATDAPAGTA